MLCHVSVIFCKGARPILRKVIYLPNPNTLNPCAPHLLEEVGPVDDDEHEDGEEAEGAARQQRLRDERARPVLFWCGGRFEFRERGKVEIKQVCAVYVVNT